MKGFFKLLLFLPVLMYCFRVNGQQQGHERIDSLLKEIPLAKEDTVKAGIYVELSNIYSGYSTDTGIVFGEQGLTLSERLKWSAGIAAANYYLGFNYYNRSDHPKSLQYLFAALKVYEAIHDERGEANTLRKTGNIYRDQKNYPKSLEYYFKALKLFEKTGDRLGMGKTFSNIGQIYAFQSRNKEAMDYEGKALNIEKEQGYVNGMVISYLRIGDIYANEQNYTASLEYKLKALDIAVNNYDKHIIAKEQLQEAYGGVGECYLNLARSISGKVDMARRDSALHNAINHLEKAIALVIDMGELIDMQAYYNCLAQAEMLSGNYVNAYDHLRLSYQLQDSLFSARNKEKITELETKREKELNDKITRLEQAKKRNELLAVISGFVVLLIIIAIVFRNNKLLSFEKSRSDDLLLNILPPQVAEELKENGSAKAKYFDHVTVLFTDFVNFTHASEQMTPQELIDELHTCFKAFDEITAKYHIEKIKTIGDAYLAAAGVPTADTCHAEHVVQAAIEINRFMQDRIAAKSDGVFRIRIGIHSGSVIAGIVGVKKFAYDIWGDTVNTAARMEQNSEAGKINISETTYQLVRNSFACTYRGEIEAKNKGKLKMYFVSDHI